MLTGHQIERGIALIIRSMSTLIDVKYIGYTKHTISENEARNGLSTPSILFSSVRYGVEQFPRVLLSCLSGTNRRLIIYKQRQGPGLFGQHVQINDSGTIALFYHGITKRRWVGACHDVIFWSASRKWRTRREQTMMVAMRVKRVKQWGEWEVNERWARTMLLTTRACAQTKGILYL